MDGFIPLLTGAGTVTIVQVKQSTTYNATFDAVPAAGNKIFALVNGQQGIADIPLDVGGLTTIGPFLPSGVDGTSGVARLGYRDVQAGDPAGPYGTGSTASNLQTTIFEVSGLPSGGPLNSAGAVQQSGTGVSQSITPTGGVDAWLVGGFGSYLYAAFGGTPTFTPNAATTAIGTLNYNTSMWGCGQPFYGESDGSAVVLGGTQGGTTNGSYRYALHVAAFGIAGGSLSWPSAPDTVDADEGTSDDVADTSITGAGGVFWRGDLGAAEAIGELSMVLGMEDAGDVTLSLQAGNASDWSDAATVIELTYTATGGFTADDFATAWDSTGLFRYWQLVLDTAVQSVRVYEVGLVAAVEPPEPEPGKAILEIYVHDEDASRWGTATWATGPATGTEGIWSAAGWQDVTPEGVRVHVIWGSRQAVRGILAQQNAASWNVETYDPDRILDPGNFDGPYWPQLVAGVPVRITHDTHVIRTGYIDEFHYKHKAPDYQGQFLCTDTWSLLNQAMVPADSILGNTLLERVQDAINAAGIAVGGIPLPPSGPAGPAIANWVEGTALDDPTSVGEHIRIATSEVLWVPYIKADAGLGLRAWGDPLDRGREITAASLEDLEAISSEDGLYSVVRVQVEDPDADPIEREAAPLPRYGRRVWERTEPTVDPEGYADAILAERPWPGVQYVPGAIHCFTAADVDYFGSLEIMERVTITVAGAVSVTGRILGGELYVEHRARDTKGAKWIFNFAVATDGATAIGLTTLVSDQAGDTLLDDAAGTEYLEAD